MCIDEMGDNQDQVNALTDPEDRISVLLFAAGVLNKQKGTIEVLKKQVSSDEKYKIKQKKAIIKRYFSDHKVQQHDATSIVTKKQQRVLHKV